MTTREAMARLCWAVTLIFGIGAAILLLELLLRLTQGVGLPEWSMIVYLSVAFGLGITYLLAEVLWAPIGRALIDGDKATDPLWKRSLRLLALIGIICMFIVAGAVLKERGW